MSDSTITVESIEALANQLEVDDRARRAKLLRMIRAYVRILALREPQLFKRRCTVYRDEDGHWDNSYPPSQVWTEATGPSAIKLRDIDWANRATSGGFYHSLRYYTTTPGLYIDRAGEFQHATLEGTGQYGQYAAHPGECDVDCTVEYNLADADEITTSDLAEAEQTLRPLAFPASANR